MMLHYGEEDHISFANKFSAPCLRHQINALSGSARKHDFVSTCSADIVRDPLARVFISFRGAGAQRVQSTVHICVFMLVVSVRRVEDSPRFLRGRGVIKIDQAMAVRLFAENREILADSVPVCTGGSNLVHTTICSTGWDAP